MDPNAIAEEIATVLRTIDGLDVDAYPPATITPPRGIVSYPENIMFDLTYGRGMDRIPDWPVWVVVGRVNSKTARQRIMAYAASVGAVSFKVVLEAHDWQSCDELTVKSVGFDVITIAGVDYIAAGFHLDIAGSGA